VFHLLPVDSAVGGTKYYGRLGKSDVEYNPWMRGMWNDDTFLHDLSARSRINLLQKTSCLLRVDSASKLKDLMNKTKACFV
jgi:hypothetical protein